MGLVPGVSLAQWIGTRLTARGLSYASRVWLRRTRADSAPVSDADTEIRELESGYRVSSSPAAEYAGSARKESADFAGL